MIIRLGGKTSDMAYMIVDELGINDDGYVPYITAIGGGDYIEIDIDNETGKVVGWVPLTEDELREAARGM